MSTVEAGAFLMNAEERALLARDGYVVREAVFTPQETAEMAADCERLMAELVAMKRAAKPKVGGYVFEYQEELEATVKWERDAPDQPRGVEPFAHLSQALNAWGHDPRLMDPCKEVCGAEEVALFTEKLNLKRARTGGYVQLHQDFPYWEVYGPQAARVATALVQLDDFTIENGCLQVTPGSHRHGKHAQRTHGAGLDKLEIDVETYDMASLVPVPAPAGSVIFFGGFLIHMSAPNHSDKDRRALLYSYQPAGFPHVRELNARFQEAARAKAPR